MPIASVVSSYIRKENDMEIETIITQYFDFLVSEYGYKKHVDSSYKIKNKIVVVYENRNCKKRIEIASALDRNNNFVILRYLKEKKFADYDNELFCIDIGTLYQLKNEKFEIDNLLYQTEEPSVFFKKSHELFKEYKSFLSSDIWIDIPRYISILETHYAKFSKRKFEYVRKSIQQEFEDELLRTIPKIEIIYNSEKQPPYDVEFYWTSKYRLNGHSIVFRMPDFRDYNIHEVVIDNIGGHEIDSFKDYKETIKQIIQHIEKKYSC